MVDDKGKFVDTEETRKMIRAEMAPFSRRLNKRLDKIEDRVSVAEKEASLAIAGYDLISKLFTEKFDKIDHKLDNQQAEIISRLDTTEKWIGGRRRWERAAVRVSQVAGLRLLRVWLPFLIMYGFMLILWWFFVSAMGAI